MFHFSCVGKVDFCLVMTNLTLHKVKCVCVCEKCSHTAALLLKLCDSWGSDLMTLLIFFEVLYWYGNTSELSTEHIIPVTHFCKDDV